MVSRRLKMIISISAMFSMAYPAFAGGLDGERMHRGHHGHFNHHGKRGGSWRPVYGGGYGVPILIPGLGTYAGSISALKIRGHGTYFYAEGLGTDRQAVEPAPSAKIIDANRSDPCSYENGVCVIRPQ